MTISVPGYRVEFFIGSNSFGQNFIDSRGTLDLVSSLETKGIEYKIQKGVYTYHVGFTNGSYISKNDL